MFNDKIITMDQQFCCSYTFPLTISYVYKQIMHCPFPGVCSMCDWAQSRQTVNWFLPGFFFLLFPSVFDMCRYVRATFSPKATEDKRQTYITQIIAGFNLSSRTFYIWPYKCTSTLPQCWGWHTTPLCAEPLLFLLSHFVFLHASDCPKCPCILRIYHHFLLWCALDIAWQLAFAVVCVDTNISV